MPKKEANLTVIMLVQQLEDAHWKTWEDKTSIQLARDGDCKPLLQAVVDKLNNENIIVKEAYGIKHNKDEMTVWNQDEMKNVTEKKPEHVHFLFKFEKGASLSKIALAIGVEPQYLEKLKSGRYGYDNCLAYLIHAKDETKHQYQPNEVITIRGEDYTSIYHRSMETWIKGRATKKAKETSLSVDWLIEKILSGEMTKNNILLTDEYYAIYGQHRRRINEAFESYTEKRNYQTIAEIEADKFKKTIIYIYAKSGAGKTQFAKNLIKSIKILAKKYNENWQSCLTASTNAFDEYNGEEILFLDDMRGSALSVSDWLKLLDPYNISPISARYHNKLGSAKVIIITNPLPPSYFFLTAKDNINEDLGQFIRRIDYFIEIHNNQFKISKSVPQDGFSLIKKNLKEYHIPHSHSLSSQKKFTKEKTKILVIKSTMKNMKWNKQ